MGHLLQSVTGKYSSQLNFSLDDSCEKLLLDYMNEVALAAVEQAAMLAEHRGALVVEEKDIQLVLSK
jgi:histone H3/H4